MTTVYIDIAKHIATKQCQCQHIDLFRGQVDTSSKEHPFNMPAVLVQFMPVIDWITNADGSQTGTLKIQFHCITTCYADTANPQRMTDIDKQMAFSHLSFVEKLHKILHNYAPICCTNLLRSGYFPDTDTDQVQVTILEYDCLFTDNSTADSVIQENEVVTPELVVEHPIETRELINDETYLL